jgi:beta-N-acetylhexosaminidase
VSPAVIRRRRVLALAACVSFAVGVTVAFAAERGVVDPRARSSDAERSARLQIARAAVDRLSNRELAGQRVGVGFSGTDVPGWLRKAIERGDVGAVILFGGNVSSQDQVRALTRELQAIERPVAQPLIIMADQEGGLVKRLPGAPDASAEEMGEGGVDEVARQGAATGRNLADMGVNVDLAPVADVARPGSNLDEDGRAFSTKPGEVARMASAFALGVQESRVAATAKHFPGFGAAPVNTDDAVVVIDTPKRKLRRVDGRPFAATIDAGVEMVMLSTAIYTALDPDLPAAFSKRVATRELRAHYGFEGVSVTDALGTPAAAPYGGPGELAVRCAKAGMDVLLWGDASGLAGAEALTRKLRKGKLDRGAFQESVARIITLRSGLAG